MININQTLYFLGTYYSADTIWYVLKLFFIDRFWEVHFIFRLWFFPLSLENEMRAKFATASKLYRLTSSESERERERQREIREENQPFFHRASLSSLHSRALYSTRFSWTIRFRVRFRVSWVFNINQILLTF